MFVVQVSLYMIQDFLYFEYSAIKMCALRDEAEKLMNSFTNILFKLFLKKCLC